MSAAPQIHTKKSAEVRNVAVDFSGALDDGETLTGEPTISVSPSGEVTTDNAAVSTTPRVILGASVPTGSAVLFRASAGTAGKKYTITVTVGTTAIPSQTLIGVVTLIVN